MELLDIATLTCEESNIPALEKVLLKLREETHEKDEGILLYEMFVENDVKGKYTFLEIYRDQEAFDAHANAAHVKAGMAAFTPLLSKPPLFDMYHFVDDPPARYPVWADACAAITAVLTIKPGQEKAFEDATREMVQNVEVNESGCLLCRLARGTENPSRYAFWEFFKSQEAVEEHMKGFDDRNSLMQPFLAGDTEVHTLRLYREK